jgi:hypothetical protein
MEASAAEAEGTRGREQEPVERVLERCCPAGRGGRVVPQAEGTIEPDRLEQDATHDA